MIRALWFAVAAAVAFPAPAQEKKPMPQKDKLQDRMTKCNRDAGAKNLKGDERKKFMSECLKA